MSQPAAQLGLFGGADLCIPEDRDRYCTPPHVVKAAREAMGGIDLDPASNAAAQRIVQAARWYSPDMGLDGLALTWAGRVWCNPPYGKGLVDRFSDKIVSELERGQVTAMLVLVNSSTSAGWWQQLARRADALLFCSSRLSFWHAETGKTQSGNFYDQTIFTFGALDLEPLEPLGAIIPKGPR